MPLRSPYTHLRFATHVDWKHVNPTLLAKLNQMAGKRGVVIDIFSGYRSDAYSAKVGGFAGDPHTKGIAIDATVGKKPIGDVFSMQDFQKAGLISGNQPNFYHGKPDPSHVQLGPGQAIHDGSAPMSTPEAPAGYAAPPAAAPSQPVDTRQVPDFSAPAVTPDYSPPGLAQPSLGNAPQVGQLWQQIASQPFASPETQAWAQNVGG